MNKILIIDDKPNIRKVLTAILNEEGYQVDSASDGWEGLQLTRKVNPDLIISDIRMPEFDGIELQHWLKREKLKIPLIFITAYGSIPLAVDAMKDGAVDFLTKPLNYDELKLKIKSVLGNIPVMTGEAGKKVYEFKEIIGSSQVMKELYSTINSIANRQSTVLIQGESGTGKELVARAIHYLGKRSEKPFVAVNCAALGKDILESELFGHRRGSFTGAVEEKIGKFEVADGGSILLDEVSEIDTTTQAKLLRVLQEKAFERVGDNQTRTVDVRVIATTNRNLRELVERDGFRSDLYYRLNVIPIYTPPLRERKEDLEELAGYFIKNICKKEGISPKKMSPGVLEIFKRYDWPGNVRELKHLIERIVIFSKDKLIRVADLPEDWLEYVPGNGENKGEQRQQIIEALKDTFGNKTKAAELIGIPRRTLYNWIKKYEINEGHYLE